MTNVTRIAGALIVLTIMWVALTERLTGPNILLGLFAALISLVLIRALHDGQNRINMSFKGILLWLLYGLSLLGQIYLSGILTLIQIFRGRFQAVIVSVETQLSDDFLIAVLAASITLTPGTVTVARNGNTLEVLWLGQTILDEKIMSDRILGSLERLLLKQEAAGSRYLRITAKRRKGRR